MSNEVAICNQALASLGSNPIISLEDDTTEAKLCQLHYAPVRDAVLQEHPWSFATKWITPNKLAGEPVGPFANAYQLPPETLQVVFVGYDYDHPNTDWQVEGDTIVTNDVVTVVQILERVIDTSKYSALFNQALISLLASEMAVALTNSGELMQTYLQMYELKVREAAAVDNQQGRSRKIRSKWLQGARASGKAVLGPYV